MRENEAENDDLSYGATSQDNGDDQADDCIPSAVVNMILADGNDEGEGGIFKSDVASTPSEKPKISHYEELIKRKRDRLAKIRSANKEMDRKQQNAFVEFEKKLQKMESLENCTFETNPKDTVENAVQIECGVSINIRDESDNPAVEMKAINTSALFAIEEKLLKEKALLCSGGPAPTIITLPPLQPPLRHASIASAPARSASIDSNIAPPALVRHSQSLPGAVRVPGPGFDPSNDTNSLVSFLDANVSPATTMPSERSLEADEENLINAILVDHDLVEATVMPHSKKRRNLLCGLLAIAVAICIAGVAPFIAKALGQEEEPSATPAKDLASRAPPPTASPVPTMTPQPSFALTRAPVLVKVTLAPTSPPPSSLPSLAPSSVPSQAPSPFPSASPTVSLGPSATPSQTPSFTPTTAMPTPSPSMHPSATPTASVTITVVIRLDEQPEETGWSLKCDGNTMFNIPPGTYENDQNRLIVVLGQSYVGAECILGITDEGGDGIAGGSYEVYFGDNIQLPSHRLVEGWGSSFTSKATAPFSVVPPPTPSPTSSPVPSISPVPTISMVNLVSVTVELKLDYFAAEVGWVLQCGGVTYANHAAGTYTLPNKFIQETFEVQEGSQCFFGILDAYGDGICCTYGNGYYALYVGETAVDDNRLVFGTLYVGDVQKDETFTVNEPISPSNIYNSNGN